MLAIASTVVLFTGASASSGIAKSAQASNIGALEQIGELTAASAQLRDASEKAMLQDSIAPSPTATSMALYDIALRKDTSAPASKAASTAIYDIALQDAIALAPTPKAASMALYDIAPRKDIFAIPPKAASMVLFDIKPPKIESVQSFSRQESYRFMEQGNSAGTTLDIHSHSEMIVRHYSEEEKIFIARVVYAEARGESFEGQVAVASVILNRYESGKFGSTVKKVVFARSQFAVSGKHNEEGLLAVEEAIARKGTYPDNMFYFQVSKRKIWRNFEYYDRIGSHSFYCSASK